MFDEFSRRNSQVRIESHGRDDFLEIYALNIATGTFEGDDSLDSLLGRTVVLDTAGSIIFLGTLLEVKPYGFWLETADLRDKAEGHVSKERYVCEAKANGVVSNRRRLFVFRHVVVSVSALDDVVLE